MGLISLDEVLKATKLNKVGIIGKGIGYSLFRLLRLNRMNEIYSNNLPFENQEFLKNLLDELDVKFEVHEEDLRKIPKEGAFISISNHPLGGLDGIILLKLLREYRSDFKVMANFLLQKIEPMKNMVLPVNPFENHKDSKSSVNGIKEAISHIKNGSPMGIFPAGEVSTFKINSMRIEDRDWEAGAIRLMKKLKVPVLPIYFHAHNSLLFYILSGLSGTLRTAKLPSELLKQKNRVIKIRIGRPITVAEQDEYKDLGEYGKFLRKKTYMLSNAYKVLKKSKYLPKFKLTKVPKNIILPIDSSKLEDEMNVLRENGSKLFDNKNYEVFLANAKDIPNSLIEIGRLREITFREVGEGTNKEIDLDEYDDYYKHLFLWDNSCKKIAGAYRMGLGSRIFKRYGIDGFYIQDLFRFEPELNDMMSKTIEMGRAFVIKEYQQKPMPLFLLWKGIIHTTLRHPEHRFLLGGVSISNQFSYFSKSLMIEFMKSHYYDPYIAQYVRPKNEYKVRLKDEDKNFVFDSSKADLNKFDKIIDDLEPGKLRIPVLMKKYIKQNAKIIAFNVDPKFNDAVDGLMYIEIDQLPESTVKPVLEEFLSLLDNKTNCNDDKKEVAE
jgi:putative hemolysin